MAQTLVAAADFQFATQAASFNPAAHTLLADQTLVAGALTTATVNTGIVGLRWARVKLNVKTFTSLAAADTFRVTLVVGTGAAITGPVNIAQANRTVETGDTKMVIEIHGSSIVGFQSWCLIVSAANSHVAVFDALFDAA